ncbi:MAG: ABC transporter ATP-binding protein [Myxococcota bacterium]|nr:ABC transporter ATP-binding protein [Myxococcota bacterium]
MSSAPVVRVRDLRFRYREGDFALRVPSLSVEAGERVAVIGPSGSGKTTLLHLVAGIQVPDAGRVETAGTVLTELDDGARRSFRIRQVGLVFQEFELLDYLSVLDNVLLPYRLNPAQRLDAAARERARSLLRRVGLGDKLERLATRLSHGERQRAAVCRALVTEPAILLADEPTGNLDPANRDRVLDILCEVAGERGATLLVVTHDHEVLDRFGRVIDFKSLQGGSAA